MYSSRKTKRMIDNEIILVWMSCVNSGVSEISMQCNSIQVLVNLKSNECSSRAFKYIRHLVYPSGLDLNLINLCEQRVYFTVLHCCNCLTNMLCVDSFMISQGAFMSVTKCQFLQFYKNHCCISLC